ncbi:MAG: DUF3417 domain-containing protein, partial [Candidatus Nanopelagicales bacterium]
SILDGWWDEWFDGENGWAIPTADGVEDADRRDDIEADALYGLIENSVAATFYDVDDARLPRRWIEMVRHTLRTLGPKVLSTRMVREYVLRLYLPAGSSSREMNVSDFSLAREMCAWKQRERSQWPLLRVDHVEADGVGDSVSLGTPITVRAFVSLGELSPDDVLVQAVYGRVDADDRFIAPHHAAMDPAESFAPGGWQYRLTLPLEQNGPFGYTVRILPHHAGLATPGELGLQVLPAMNIAQ